MLIRCCSELDAPELCRLPSVLSFFLRLGSEKGVRLAQNLAQAFLWEYSSDKGLKLAQFLGQLGVFLTCLSQPAANVFICFI